MKKSISVFAMILTIVFLGSTVSAQEYRGIEIPGGDIAFADEWVSYNPGLGDIGAGYDDPNKALGIADYDDKTGAGQVSLGSGGSIVLKFNNNSLTTSGDSNDDLWIFEAGIVERGKIEIRKEGSSTWIDVGYISASVSGIDIDAYLADGVELWGKYSYVRITDAGDGDTDGTPYPGVDIDAIAAISSDGPVGTGDSPIANPGDVQSRNENTLVYLNGAYSVPPLDGTIDGWLWTQTGGTPLVTLANETTAIASFTTPATAPAALTFQLTVTASNSKTDSDTTIVNVINGHIKPTAGISPQEQTKKEDDTVTLISNSSAGEVDGTIQIYLWEQLSGTTASLTSTNTKTTTFIAPQIGASGESLKFKLTVTDNDGLKDTATAVVNIVKAEDTNTAPIANAGPDQDVAQGDTVTLDGTGSSDPDAGDVITYSWTKLSGPDVTLSSATLPSPFFTAPSSGNVAIEFQLAVTDNVGLTKTDTVIINVLANSNTPPTANAGEDQTVDAGASVTLDGTSSTDAEDSTITTFFWRQLSGTGVELSDPSSTQPTFTAPAAGNETLEFELTVTDSEGSKKSDTCIVTVNPPATGGGDDSDSCFINSMNWNSMY